MTYKEYQEQRANLMTEATDLVNEGKLEESQAKAQEVEALDAKWDATKEALDNLQALSEEQRIYNVQSLTGAEVKDGVATARVDLAPVKMTEEEEMTASSKVYETAWAKTMMGQNLTDAEQKAFSLVNSTLTTSTTGAVIPTTTAEGIWDLIEEEFPYFADVEKTYVSGAFKFVVSTASSDAAWYEEDTATADGSETLTAVTLNGCELARAVTISWKLREQAISDFIPFIQRKLAHKMGAGCEYGVLRGQGASASAPEPTGVITALLAESNTPQVVTYTANALTYGDITSARAKIAAGSDGLVVYANAATIWGVLANVKDGNNRPIFIADPANGGVYRILGMPVKESSGMQDGKILISNARVGYIANIDKDITLQSEEHVKARTVDYCAYAIVDGNVTTTKAHALLQAGE